MPLRVEFDMNGLDRVAASQKDYCDDYSVILTATILGKVTKKEEPMLELKTRSECEVDKEPNVNDLDPYIIDAVIEAR